MTVIGGEGIMFMEMYMMARLVPLIIFCRPPEYQNFILRQE